MLEDEDYLSWDRQLVAFWVIVVAVLGCGLGVLWGLDHGWF